MEALTLFHLFFSYLDLYLLGDDTSFMQTKNLFVLIHIRNKSEVGTIKLVFLALQDFFTDRGKVVLLWILFVNYLLCLSCYLVCSLQPCCHLLGYG